MHWMPSVRRRVTLAALAPAVALLIAGCGDDGSGKPSDARPAASSPSKAEPASSASKPSSVPPSTKKPVPPKAADGKDLGACSDSKCEVEVKVGDVIRFKGKPDIKELAIVNVADGALTMGPSTNGTVNALITANSEAAGAEAGPATMDGVTVNVLYADGTRAVIRVS